MSSAESLTAGETLVRQSREWESQGTHFAQQSASASSYSDDGGRGLPGVEGETPTLPPLGKIDVDSSTEIRRTRFSREDHTTSFWQTVEIAGYHESGRDMASGDRPAATRSTRQTDALSYDSSNETSKHEYSERGFADLNNTLSEGESYASDSYFGSTNRDTSRTASSELVTTDSRITTDARGDPGPLSVSKWETQA